MAAISGFVFLSFLLLGSVHASVVVEPASATIFKRALLVAMRSSFAASAHSKKPEMTPNKALGIVHSAENPIPQSLQGYNTNSYKRFMFNKSFNSTQYSDAPQVVYDVEAAHVRAILDFLDYGILVGTNVSAYEQFAGILQQAFELEQGAIFYSIVTQKWMFCAWLGMPFFDVMYNIRLCATLTSFGLADVDRAPVPNEDYVATAEMQNMIYHGKVKKIYNEIDEMGNDDRQLMLNSSVRENDVVYVDLGGSRDDYEEICLSQDANIHSDCYAFCCNSLYIGSHFCTDFPLNCI